MDYEMFSYTPKNNLYNMHIPYKTLEYSMSLLRRAIELEARDEAFYSYLLTLAPTEEEKDIIASIRDDERRHNASFREIYEFYSGEYLRTRVDSNTNNYTSYIEGIRKARLQELSAAKMYRDIRAGIPDQFFKDMIFEILTDELIHAQMYGYITSLNLEKQIMNKCLRNPNIDTIERHFTENDAYLIAKVLGVDFTKEKFDVEQFRMGLDVELEHGKVNELTNVTDDDSIKTGKIALAHLREFPDYYTRLKKMEEEAMAYWASEMSN